MAPSSPTRPRFTGYLVAAFAVLFLVVVVIAQVTGRSPDPVRAEGGAGSAASHPSDSPLALRRAGDPQALGDQDAPVVMSVWTDFRCPFCAVFNRETLPTLIQEYVETGKVRIEMHEVSFFGDESRAAAVAARAAGEQGRFFEFMGSLYAAAPQSGHPEMPRAKLTRFAEQAGVPDLAGFQAALDDPELARQVDQSTRDAQTSGITGVPFFVVGGQALSGAQPIEVFRSFLDTAVAPLS